MRKSNLSKKVFICLCATLIVSSTFAVAMRDNLILSEQYRGNQLRNNSQVLYRAESTLENEGKSSLKSSQRMDALLAVGKKPFSFFNGDWCGFSQRQKGALGEIEQEYGDFFDSIRLNTEVYQKEAEAFEVLGHPTMFSVIGEGDNGCYSAKIDRYTDREELIDEIENTINLRNLRNEQPMYSEKHNISVNLNSLPAQFTDVYVDSGLDMDRNGLYDYLAIDVGVNVSELWYYYVSGYLYNNNSGYYIDSISNYTTLNAGNQTVQLRFNGATIWQIRTNGTFDLNYLSLHNAIDQSELDYRNHAYTTHSYNYTNFRPPALFIPGIKDYGYDENSNGLDDYLVVEKQITVTTAGNYELDGYLYNDSGYWLDANYNYTYLSAGIHNLTLKFSGYTIYNSESSGNFTVYMDLYCGDLGWRWLDSAEDITSYHSYAQFERPPAQFTDVYTDRGLDTDSNGLYDYLAIDVGVNVSTSGNYSVEVDLHALDGTHLTQNSTYLYLPAGSQNVTVLLDGLDIRGNKINGPFVLDDVWLRGNDYNLLDYRNDPYITHYYNYTDFQRPPAELGTEFRDYGLDTNGNVFYDYLVIEKQINVTTAGNYELDGSLYNDSGYWLDSKYNYTYLSEGIHNLTLMFSGYTIYNSKSTGNFTVYMDLYGGDVSWRWLDSAENLTSYYSYAQFERPPAELGTEFRDYGLDTNGNVLYDHLVIEKQVNVTIAGDYELDGSLVNDSGYEIDSKYNYTYLSEGIHNLTLKFNGYKIYHSESSGNFTVYMDLYGGDVSWRWLDSAENLTSYYSYAQFERPRADVLVALFEDSYPWGYTAIEDQLWANGILFTLYDSSDMGEVDLMPYTKVITASVQSNTFWNALAGNKNWFEDYVCQGGVLEMHLCAQQSHTAWGKVFPGGFVTAWGTTNTISIADTTHPVVNIPNKITDQDLDQWGYSAHGNFSAIPTGATVVLTATDTDKPVFVEAKLGNGTIIATTQTVEWRAGHRYPEFLENMILFMPPAASYFDTGTGTYPSIAGTHNGTIKPLWNITVSNLYTYPCPGTGGHTEYVKIWTGGATIAEKTWSGYLGDWHNLTFDESFTLYANETYNYTIRTGSYPQIIHAPSCNATGVVITCTAFVDHNGQRHEGWIPAIRLY
jgi:hypothetical protein